MRETHDRASAGRGGRTRSAGSAVAENRRCTLMPSRIDSRKKRDLDISVSSRWLVTRHFSAPPIRRVYDEYECERLVVPVGLFPAVYFRRSRTDRSLRTVLPRDDVVLRLFDALLSSWYI